MTATTQPSDSAMTRIRTYVEKYRRKTGTVAHPNHDVTESVVLGLAQNVDETGRPLCPCNFYADKKPNWPAAAVGFVLATK